MRRQDLVPHLLLQLLHRRSLDFDRSIRVPARHFQEPTRDDVEDVAVRLRVADLAALAAGFHVRRQCRGRLEHLEAFQAAVVRALMEARGQMQLQMIQFVVRFPDDN